MAEQPGVEEYYPNRRRWTFDRRVTMGEVLTAITVLLMIWFKVNAIVDEQRQANTQMDKRVSILEEKVTMQKQIDAAQDQVARDGQARIEAALAEIQRFLREQRARGN